MNVDIDPSNPLPPFEQLREQISGLVLGGRLKEGDRLPSIRQLAADLAIAPGTVARAYAELETAGVVTTARARGTRVAAQVSVDAVVHEAADSFIRAARREGLDLSAMLALLRARNG